MSDCKYAQFLCQPQCVVRARIVNQNDVVNEVSGNLAKCHFEGLRRIVGGQHNANLSVCNHAVSTFRSLACLMFPPVAAYLLEMPRPHRHIETIHSASWPPLSCPSFSLST